MRPGLPALLLALTAAAALAADPPKSEEEKPETPSEAPVPVPLTPPPPPAPAPKVNLVPSLSGFLQVQFAAGLDNTGEGVSSTATVFIRRGRIRVKGNVAQGIGYTFLADLATVNNLLRDAFLSTTLVPHHEIRLGQQKTQFGYENPEAATELLFINFAYASEALARGPDLRDLGVGVLGQWELPGGFGVDYQLTAVNGAGPNVLVDDTPRKNLWARAGGSYGDFGWKLKVGVSGATGDRLFKADPVTMQPAYKVLFTRLGVDVRADTLWFFAAAEGALGTNDPSTGTGATTAAGGYVMAIGKTSWNVGPLVRAEFYDPDLAAVGDRLQRFTLGAYVDLKSEELRGQLKAGAIRLLINLDLDASETRRDHAVLSWVQAAF